MTHAEKLEICRPARRDGRLDITRRAPIANPADVIFKPHVPRFAGTAQDQDQFAVLARLHPESLSIAVGRPVKHAQASRAFTTFTLATFAAASRAISNLTMERDWGLGPHPRNSSATRRNLVVDNVQCWSRKSGTRLRTGADLPLPTVDSKYRHQGWGRPRPTSPDYRMAISRAARIRLDLNP